MSVTRLRQTDRGVGRWLAVIVAFVFLQGMLGTFLHFDVESHYYCVEHEQLTHDAEHARDARQTAHQSVADRSVDPTDKPSQPEESPETRDCQWLTWLQNSSQASPDLAPKLLDLPPPAPGLEASTSQPHQTLRDPISISHVSPMNSPPEA